jgi:flavin-binding protein dodecin
MPQGAPLGVGAGTEATQNHCQDGRSAKNALEEARKTLRNIRSIYIKEFEAKVENDRIVEFRINAKISLDLEGNRAAKPSR